MLKRPRPGRPPEESSARTLALTHEYGRRLSISSAGQEILQYVYEPWDAQLESPRPYFHPIRTLSGQEMTVYRPHDHVWHKGLAWSLPNVGTENFWGGPTFRRGRGYEQLDNNGAMSHRGFASITAERDSVSIVENLDWITRSGVTWVEEERTFTVQLSASDPDAWVLNYGTRFTNVSGCAIPLGSPTTEGRENAGYGGLFWRGPRSFTNGRIYAPDISGGDELNGIRSPWMAFSGNHDASGGASTLIFVDAPDNPRARDEEHTQWFARTGLYACLSPSPFYSQVSNLAEGQTLNYNYALVVVDGDVGITGSQKLAESAIDVLQATASHDAAKQVN